MPTPVRKLATLAQDSCIDTMDGLTRPLGHRALATLLSEAGPKRVDKNNPVKLDGSANLINSGLGCNMLRKSYISDKMKHQMPESKRCAGKASCTCTCIKAMLDIKMKCLHLPLHHIARTDLSMQAALLYASRTAS